jgi:transposase-like protein
LESHAPGARVVDVVHRHGVAAQQVTTWRREARQDKLDTRKTSPSRPLRDSLAL